MKIIAPEFTRKGKSGRKSSPVLATALETVKTTLLTDPGISYKDLIKRVSKEAECGRNTITTALSMYREAGSVITKSEGRLVRHYWSASANLQAEDLLPIRRQMIDAVNAPRVGGEVLTVCDWIRQQLEVA